MCSALDHAALVLSWESCAYQESCLPDSAQSYLLSFPVPLLAVIFDSYTALYYLLSDAANSCRHLTHQVLLEGVLVPSIDRCPES